MNIWERVYRALKPVGLPVFRNQWQPDIEYPEVPPRYIVVLRTGHRPVMGGDNRDQAFVHHLRVDVHGSETVDDAADAARAALNDAGFCVKGDVDVSDAQGQWYQVCIEADYYDFLEG